jgi:hypothetical protein
LFLLFLNNKRERTERTLTQWLQQYDAGDIQIHKSFSSKEPFTGFQIANEHFSVEPGIKDIYSSHDGVHSTENPAFAENLDSNPHLTKDSSKFARPVSIKKSAEERQASFRAYESTIRDNRRQLRDLLGIRASKMSEPDGSESGSYKGSNSYTNNPMRSSNTSEDEILISFEKKNKFMVVSPHRSESRIRSSSPKKPNPEGSPLFNRYLDGTPRSSKRHVSETSRFPSANRSLTASTDAADAGGDYAEFYGNYDM